MFNLYASDVSVTATAVEDAIHRAATCKDPQHLYPGTVIRKSRIYPTFPLPEVTVGILAGIELWQNLEEA
ncbi:hypothetical protein OPV22_023241 [Ensete ventricosum]|uniref:Uncharacterized protein n=1 Tax=Ensete ventricosum TaxID=4639 RepID=A0AAV8QW94_ENSVE|nr:hypothetical protein OPV22_023241 [Ensete ventricosum]